MKNEFDRTNPNPLLLSSLRPILRLLPGHFLQLHPTSPPTKKCPSALFYNRYDAKKGE